MQATAHVMSKGSEFSEIIKAYKALFPFLHISPHHSKTCVTGKVLESERII